MDGFDDSSAAVASSPDLTTLRQPCDRISSEMVRVLLARIGGEDPAAVILPTELVTRQSTCAPANARLGPAGRSAPRGLPSPGCAVPMACTLSDREGE